MPKYLLSFITLLLLLCGRAYPQAMNNLPPASVPLSGAEIVPLVQSGIAKDATAASIAALSQAHPTNFVCSGTDDSAAVQSAINALASPGLVQLTGACVVVSPLVSVTMNGVAATLAGNGPASINVSGGHNGPAITLENGASLTIQGLSIIQTQTSPAQAGTGLSITAVPPSSLFGSVYPGVVTIKDSTIAGSTATNGWTTPLSLNSVGTTFITQTRIISPNGGSSDRGDVGVAINGPTNSENFTAGVQFTTSYIQGSSTGVKITGDVQGVTFLGGGVLGDWRGIYWNGGLLPEGLLANGVAFNAYDHAVLCTSCSGALITGSTTANFGGNASWVGFEFDDGNNNAVIANPFIVGQAAPTGYGIIIATTNPTTGIAPNQVEDNNVIGAGTCIWLKGTTTTGTIVTGNAGECPVPLTQDSSTGNSVYGNSDTFGGAYIADISELPTGEMVFNNAGSAGSYTFRGDAMTLDAAGVAAPAMLSFDAISNQSDELSFNRVTSGVLAARWILVGANGTPETGSNVGSDFQLARANDAGTLIDEPITIPRSSGIVNVLHGLSVGSGPTAGVTCSGTPTSSFAVVGGVVTHC